MRRLVALLSFVCFVLVTVAARAEPVRMWHAYREGGLEQKALAETLAAFRRAHPGVEIELLAVPHDGYMAKLAAAIPAGNGPHVFLDAHERVGDFRDRKLVSAVGDAAPPDELAGYAPAALAAVTVDGVLYGIPLSRKCLALYLNDALVPNDPVDLESLGDLKLPAGVVPIAHTAGAAYAHAAFLSAYGGSLLGPDDSFGMDSEAGVRSVEAVAAMVKRGAMPSEASGALIADLFSAGKAASAISGPWLSGDLKGDVKYRVVPLPILRSAGAPLRPLLTVEAAFLSPDGAKSSDARAFARFLGSADAAAIRARVGRTVSARAVPSSDEASDPFLLAFARAADAAVPMPTRAAMRLVFEPTDRALRKVLRGDMDAKTALAEGRHRFEDVRRPLPPATSSTPYSAVLGLLALAGAAVLMMRARDPEARQAFRRSLPAYAYLSQAAVAVIALVVLPLTVGAATSFFAGRGDSLRFVGMANYLSILTARGGPLLASGSFYLVLLVTLLWTLCNVALHVLIGVSLGILLAHPRLRLRAAYRVLLIIPWAVPSYVTALAWKGMFHQQFGAINAILGYLSIEPVAWFSRFSTAFAANLATNVWLGFPFVMVVTVGAVAAVPDDVLEAAAVDGATAWERLRLVTLPMIRPALAPAIALGAVWTFNMFNVVFLVSGGDPDGTTDILVSEAYRWAFTREAQMGYAAAYAVLIFLLLFFGTRVLSRITQKLSGASLLEQEADARHSARDARRPRPGHGVRALSGALGGQPRAVVAPRARAVGAADPHRAVARQPARRHGYGRVRAAAREQLDRVARDGRRRLRAGHPGRVRARAVRLRRQEGRHGDPDGDADVPHGRVGDPAVPAARRAAPARHANGARRLLRVDVGAVRGVPAARRVRDDPQGSRGGGHDRRRDALRGVRPRRASGRAPGDRRHVPLRVHERVERVHPRRHDPRSRRSVHASGRALALRRRARRRLGPFRRRGADCERARDGALLLHAAAPRRRADRRRREGVIPPRVAVGRARLPTPVRRVVARPR
jgi:arabinogalactan oligomer/maltooligosaccharide transport system permease protein